MASFMLKEMVKIISHCLRLKPTNNRNHTLTAEAPPSLPCPTDEATVVAGRNIVSR